MITFDPKTRQHYQSETTLIIHIREKGCDGNSLEIIEGYPSENDIRMESNLTESVQVFIQKNKQAEIDGGFITRVGEKWILSHPNILTRCGCGKSFSFKSGNGAQDKITILRKKLQQRNKHHHL